MGGRARKRGYARPARLLRVAILLFLARFGLNPIPLSNFLGTSSEAHGPAEKSLSILPDLSEPVFSGHADCRGPVFDGDLRQQHLVGEVRDGGLANLRNLR